MSNTRIYNTQLKEGVTKKGESYPRHIQFKPGMEELVKVVAGLQKDVNRINEAITLQGATNYARKHGRNWEAHEADITGPEGAPDGIKEVFVTDGSGNVKVINGYGLGVSDYILRKLHRTVYPTPESRKGHTLSGLNKALKKVKPGFDPETGAVSYAVELNELPNIDANNINQFQPYRTIIKPREYFKQVFFEPVFESFKESMEAFPPLIRAQIFNKALGKAYKYFVVNEVIAHAGMNPAAIKQSKISKTMKERVADTRHLFTQAQNNANQLGEAWNAGISQAIGDEIQAVEAALHQQRQQAPPPQQRQQAPLPQQVNYVGDEE